MFDSTVQSMLDEHCPDFVLGKKYPDVDNEVGDDMSTVSSLDLGDDVNISGILSDLDFERADSPQRKVRIKFVYGKRQASDSQPLDAQPLDAQLSDAEEDSDAQPPDAQLSDADEDSDTQPSDAQPSDKAPEYASLLDEFGGAESLLQQLKIKKIMSPESVYATVLMYPEVYTPIMVSRSGEEIKVKTPPGTERRQTKSTIRDLQTMMQLHPYLSTVLSVVTHHPVWKKVKDMQLMWGKNPEGKDSFLTYLKRSAATVKDMQGTSFFPNHKSSFVLNWAEHRYLKNSDERPRLVDLLFGALSDVKQQSIEKDFEAPPKVNYKKRARDD